MILTNLHFVDFFDLIGGLFRYDTYFEFNFLSFFAFSARAEPGDREKDDIIHPPVGWKILGKYEASLGKPEKYLDSLQTFASQFPLQKIVLQNRQLSKLSLSSFLISQPIECVVFRNLDLKKLPTVIGEFQGLQELDVSGNERLSHLPDSLAQLAGRLTRLDVRGCPMLHQPFPAGEEHKGLKIEQLRALFPEILVE